VLTADGSHKPIARLNDAIKATISGSRPKRVANLDRRIAHREGHRERHRRGILREAGAPRRVIFGQDEGANLAALRFALDAPLSADDGHHFARNHVPIRVHGHQETAPFEGKSDAAPRRRRAGCSAQTHRLALQIQKLLGVDLAADFFDRVEQLALEWRELLDLTREPLLIREHFPRRLETQRNGRRRRAAEVVARDAVRDIRMHLREQRARAARVFAFPRSELQHVRDG
jgi:hypothetical protein